MDATAFWTAITAVAGLLTAALVVVGMETNRLRREVAKLRTTSAAYRRTLARLAREKNDLLLKLVESDKGRREAEQLAAAQRDFLEQHGHRFRGKYRTEEGS